MRSKSLPWAVFAAFVACAPWADGHARLFAFDGRLGMVKLVA